MRLITDFFEGLRIILTIQPDELSIHFQLLSVK